jgi:hypothetical protein
MGWVDAKWQYETEATVYLTELSHVLPNCETLDSADLSVLGSPVLRRPICFTRQRFLTTPSCTAPPLFDLTPFHDSSLASRLYFYSLERFICSLCLFLVQTLYSCSKVLETKSPYINQFCLFPIRRVLFSSPSQTLSRQQLYLFFCRLLQFAPGLFKLEPTELLGYGHFVTSVFTS